MIILFGIQMIEPELAWEKSAANAEIKQDFAKSVLGWLRFRSRTIFQSSWASSRLAPCDFFFMTLHFLFRNIHFSSKESTWYPIIFPRGPVFQTPVAQCYGRGLVEFPHLPTMTLVHSTCFVQCSEGSNLAAESCRFLLTKMGVPSRG